MKRTCVGLAYSLLYEGNWFEHIDPTWWDGKPGGDYKEWTAQLLQLIESLPADTLITLVDYHH